MSEWQKYFEFPFVSEENLVPLSDLSWDKWKLQQRSLKEELANQTASTG